MKDYTINRRALLERTAAGLAAASLPAWFQQQAIAAEEERLADLPRRIGPNDTLNIGLIGAGGSKGGFRQGLGDARGIASKPGVKCIAVCDLDRTHCAEAAKVFGPDTKQFHDFRELLREKDIDAVVIGTPDHWHTSVALAAMKAGKDVYCEKPLTLFIDEGKALVKTQHQTRRVFQVGSQQRSDQRFRMACELVRNGRLGKITRVEARLPNGTHGGPFPVTQPPADFDWEMWLGPAPETEYIKERTHGTFRHWYEYSGGMMTDWGAHHLDITQWGLGMDDAGPVHVESVGIVPAVSNGYNVAYDFTVTYTYPGDIKVLAMHEGENGVRFEGERGWIFVSRSTIQASDPHLLDEPLPSNGTRLYLSNNHHQNFVDCVRNRKQPICPVEVGHRSATVCHLGNISMRMGGRKLDWDAKAERISNDEEANRMLGRPYRGPWKLG